MPKIAALIHVLAGSAFAVAGGLVVLWCGMFLSAAPRDHVSLVAWAFIIGTVGFYLVVRGIGHVRLGAVRLQGRPHERGESQ